MGASGVIRTCITPCSARALARARWQMQSCELWALKRCSPQTMPEPTSSESQINPQVNPWIIAIAVMFGTFMEVLDTTVVNVSLPHIAGSLSATIDEATWALTSYLVANAVILPMTGWLANFFGRKRLLMMSVGGFTIASFFCGFATSLPM